MALQGDCRQKYRHYGEHFISPSVIGLPCFFGFLTSTTFARKKRTNFHHFIEFNECFYLNLQSILIRLYGYLSRIYPALEFQVKTVN